MKCTLKSGSNLHFNCTLPSALWLTSSGNRGADSKLVGNVAQSVISGPDQDGSVKQDRGYEIKIGDADPSSVQSPKLDQGE